MVGSDFHPEFLDWLFDSAQRLIAPPRERERDISPVREREHRDRSPVRSRRLLDSALGGLGNNKRKSDADAGSNKRRISEGLPSAPAAAPGGPRAMMGEGRGLADRMGPRRGGMAVRGMGRGGMGGGMSTLRVVLWSLTGRRRIWVQRKRNTESDYEHEHEPISGLWKLFQSWTTGDDGSDDDDASQHGPDGRDDATHGRG